MRLVGLLAVMLLVSGCAAPRSTQEPAVVSTSAAPVACPDALTAQAAYTAADHFLNDDLPEQGFTLQLEGTVEGDVGTFVFAHNPATKALRLTAPDLEMRVVGTLMSYEDDEDGFQTRNHQPDFLYDLAVESFNEDDSEDTPDSFLDGLQQSDYTASCTTYDGKPAIEFRYDQGGLKSVLVVERSAPYRILGGERVDPALQDNHRLRMIYELPTIVVDTDLPRQPLTIEMDVLQLATNERGGTYMLAEIAAGTAWVPLHEVEFQLTDGSTIYYQDAISDGLHDMEDGDLFRYDDRDDNGLVSADDVFEFDVGPGLDVAFWDTWADAGAGLTAA